MMMNFYSPPPLYLSSGPFSKSHSGCTARSSRFGAKQSTVYQTAKPACGLTVQQQSCLSAQHQVG